jgi:hypothetical protein
VRLPMSNKFNAGKVLDHSMHLPQLVFGVHLSVRWHDRCMLASQTTKATNWSPSLLLKVPVFESPTKAKTIQSRIAVGTLRSTCRIITQLTEYISFRRRHKIVPTCSTKQTWQDNVHGTWPLSLMRGCGYA